MPARIPLPPHLDGRPFSVATARAHGLGPGRLRGPDVERPFVGVRAPVGYSAAFTGLVRSYAQRMPRSACFSHATAARLWGIPLPDHLEQQESLDVSVPIGSPAPRGKLVRGHRLQLPDGVVTRLDGLPITTLAQTWCDLAVLLDDENLLAAGDFLVWRKRPPWLQLETADLRDAVAGRWGRRGAARLGAVLPELSDRADSPPESRLRLRFLRAGLPRFEINPELWSGSGEFLAQPDLCSFEFRVAFDYEGDHHRTDPRQWEKDIARVPRLRREGWSHLRASKADLRDSTRLIQDLALLLREGGWSGRAG